MGDACRAGTATSNYAGDEKNLRNIAWFHKNSGKQTQPVAMKGCNAWGLYDMLGNVWEWCSDGGDAKRSLRGGCWVSRARFVRAAYRRLYKPDFLYHGAGFRCALVRQ